MKKITALLILAALTLSLASCAGTVDGATDDSADYGLGLSGLKVPGEDTSEPDTGDLTGKDVLPSTEDTPSDSTPPDTAAETTPSTEADTTEETTPPTEADTTEETTPPTEADTTAETTPPTEPPTPETTAPTEPPAPELTTEEKIAIANSLIGSPVSKLYKAIGKPDSFDYAPQCIGGDEQIDDGLLYYDGFVVYTERTLDREIIVYVE